MDNETFQVEETHTHTFRRGWGVFVDTFFDDDDRISDIEVSVLEIRPELVSIVGECACLQLREKSFVPVANFRELDELNVDDSHDLRTRWFPTEQEARDHAASVQALWHNPNPWTAFVVVR